MHTRSHNERAQPAAWKVGTLARRTGLTIRTLHYYDQIGLLSPSRYTESGHRLYGTEDVARLQQIKSLRALGFSLEEIRDCLGQPDFSPLRVIQMHLARLREEIEMQRQLVERLEGLEAGLRHTDALTADEFLQTIEAMTIFERYYTRQQLEQIKERGRQIGEERIRAVEAEWPELIAQVRAAMERGDDPAGEPVQALARRWMELVREFTGGDPGIARSVRAMYQHEPHIRARYGLDQGLFEFVNRALAAGGIPIPG
jgi:DNA-binding transcriptional MerR regulator